MTEWRPIDTAPVGEPVLIYDPHQTYGEGAWSWCNDERPCVIVAIQGNQGWCGDLVEFEIGWESTGSYTVTQQFSPTHWMPLPEPPK